MTTAWQLQYILLPVLFPGAVMEHGRPAMNQPQANAPGTEGGETVDPSVPEYGQTHEPSTEFHQFTHEQHGNTPVGLNPLDMSNVASALPDYASRQVPQHIYQQPYHYTAQGSATMYPYSNAQHPAQMSNNFSVPFQPPMYPQGFTGPRAYAPYPMNSNLSGIGQVFPGQGFYPQHHHMSATIPNQFSPVLQGASFGQMPSHVLPARVTPQLQQPHLRMENLSPTIPQAQEYLQGIRRTSSSSSLQASSVLRGPPRKPKQSGHALWVGNLPPGTNITDLKDHFSREATEDIESVFLISKSNCAFVNYKSEVSCIAAMSRFHDSRFNGVRLVCRLRRGSGSTSASASTVTGGPRPQTSASEAQTTALDGLPEQKEGQTDHDREGAGGSKIKERFFVIKSLTIEDLERSVSSGIWATQSHNEAALNRAFESAEKVYLIFSANKSGEYFGYACMDSAIDGETVPLTELRDKQVPQQPSNTSIGELPLTITTPATNTAPRGYIIDDSARGTIFWEAESAVSEVDGGPASPSPALPDSGDISGDDLPDTPQGVSSPLTSSSQNAAFGKPFKITWISTDRLPFYRTRGLRNPWNTNREVKIARDGTELEPSVGRKLIGMFGTSMSPTPSHPQGQFQAGMGTMPGQGPAYRPF